MEEFKALSNALIKSQKPSKLEIVLLSEVVRLKGVPQDPKYHPEGDAFVHTMEVIDRAAKLIEKSQLTDREKLIYMLGALLHDVGKYTHTFYRDNNEKKLTHWSKPRPNNTRIVSYGHDQAGIEVAKEALSRLAPARIKLKKEIVSLVKFHMRPLLMQNSRIKAFKKIKDAGGDLFLIGMLSWADKGERPEYWFKRTEELSRTKSKMFGCTKELSNLEKNY